MGCFIGCFRGRDDRRRHTRKPLLPDSSVSKSIVNCDQEAVISRNRLSSLFLADENDDVQSKDAEAVTTGSPGNMKGLKNEAIFLKSCDTLMETPIEINKASHKLRESPPWDREYDSVKNNSCAPIEHCQESGKGSGSSGNSPSSCVTSEKITQKVFPSSTEGTERDNTTVRSPAFQYDEVDNSNSPCPLVNENNGKSKSVRFVFDMNTSLSDKLKSDFSSNPSEGRLSPYPTPLKLSNEMQTPGTAFPINLDNLPNSRTRIRSQYVNSVLNPVESDSQWKLLKENDSEVDQHSGELSKCIEDHNISTAISEMGEKESSKGKTMNVEASLSAWLKPVTPTDNQNYGSLIRKNSNFGTNPGERPIIGMVAAHWHEDQPSQISSKWWDGNGIPNSTNKYKEDQKVSWHATSFEERLEKALSEESSISQRKNFEKENKGFEENEESDTALSQLQSSSAHPKWTDLKKRVIGLELTEGNESKLTCRTCQAE